MQIQHTPVLKNEAGELLNIKSNGIYVDATVGGGGHSQKILEKLGKQGCLVGIDLDQDALKIAENKLSKYRNFKLIHGNFKNLKQILALLKIDKINGILFDLGISSYQLSSKRGFSFQTDSELDMRMDQSHNMTSQNLTSQNLTGQNLTAKDLINKLSEEELSKIIYEFSQERYSRRIARKITQERAKIKTTLQLAEIIKNVIPKNKRPEKIHPATRTFQALRIAVNSELSNLRQGLEEAVSLLSSKGRIVVISYHSLEDRITKQIFRRYQGRCICPKEEIVCRCRAEELLKIITPKPLTPTAEEIGLNPRARSAKLRAAERI